MTENKIPSKNKDEILLTTREENNKHHLFFSERVNLLYNQPLHLILIIQATLLSMAAWYLWNDITKNILVIWLSFSMLATIVMFNNVAVFKKKNLTAPRYLYWYKLFVVSIIVEGLIWGSPAFFPSLFDSANSVILITILMLGVIAGAVTVMSPFVILFYIFSTMTLLPITIMLIYTGGELYITFGIMTLLYFAAQIISSKNMQHVLLKSLQLRFENVGLIDDLKIKNQQAERSKEDAEQANTAKSKFLAAASHDLRQPLHALGLFISKVNNEQRYPEIKTDIENIKKSSDALESLLNALLDISKLDAGILQPKIKPVILQTLLNRVATNGNSQALEKNLVFRVRNSNKMVLSDSHMLERILNNFVSNAIRYTTTGAVLVGCRYRKDHIRIEVRDSGIGIKENELGDIFEEFYQLENPERDRNKGLGLGLAIVERLCSLMDHKLTVQSKLGTGSVFAIEIPLVETSYQPTLPAPIPDILTSDVAGLCVLVIDDEAMIREGMAAILGEWHCSYLLADSADTAMSKLKQNDFMPDIIISDYRLRENKTGAQAIKQINELLKKDIPAIIITGDTAPDRLQEAKDSGYQLLHKPVAPAKLRSVMSYLRE